jgi:hypothetical protein
MIFTALSEMSRTSQAFRVVDFETDPLRQDTVQNLTSIMLPSGQMSIPKPSIYVSGAISYVDQNVLLNNDGAGVSGKRFELGYSQDLITTNLGLELHVGDFRSRTLYPGIDSANELVAGNKGRGLEAGALIKKAGVQFSFERGLSQGVGPAVRTLVDLGMVELVGKWAHVPYWQCLSLDQAHPEFQRQLYEWFNGMAPDEQARLFQTGLRSMGYYEGAIDGQTSPALREAIVLYQADHQATASGDIDFETYERLMKNYVASDSQNGFVRIGWARDNGDKGRGFAQKPRNGQPAFDSANANPIGVNVSLGRKENRLALGESLLLNVNVDRTAFVYCFYQDAKGGLTQIYPSEFQPIPRLQAQRSMLIPDAGNPDSFTLETTAPGHESAGCFASNSDLAPQLDHDLHIAPLKPITSVHSLAELDQKFHAMVTAPAHMGAGYANWEVAK